MPIKKKNDPFQEELTEVRSLFSKELMSGSFSNDLYQRLEKLENEEKERLKDALPAFRKKRLNSDSFQAKVSILVKEGNKISETDLDSSVKEKLDKLSLSEEIPEPEGKISDFLSYSFGDNRLTLQEGNEKKDFLFSDSIYAFYGSLFCGYVFCEDGKVFYLEKDGEWLKKDKEILADIFLQKGIIEKKDTSLLFLDGDNNYCSITTNRLSSVDDLFKEEK